MESRKPIPRIFLLDADEPPTSHPSGAAGSIEGESGGAQISSHTYHTSLSSSSASSTEPQPPLPNPPIDKLASLPVFGRLDLVSHFSLNALHHNLKKAPPSSKSTDTHKPSTNLDDSTYLDYVQDIPGKNECVMDKTIKDAIFNPLAGNRSDIHKLDREMLAAAFTLKPGTIPGFNLADLGVSDEVVTTLTTPAPKPTVTLPVDVSAAQYVKPTIRIRFGSVEDVKSTPTPSGDGGQEKKKKKKKKRSDDEDDDGSPAKKKKKKKKHKERDHDPENA
ncbi:hypothetical protein HDU76_009435 [Blyttiomyces sp. JEL0837]|nr:hypothetical protein HDU76_009435 [Blyttiomyces sp. JEL0837]